MDDCIFEMGQHEKKLQRHQQWFLKWMGKCMSWESRELEKVINPHGLMLLFMCCEGLLLPLKKLPVVGNQTRPCSVIFANYNKSYSWNQQTYKSVETRTAIPCVPLCASYPWRNETGFHHVSKQNQVRQTVSWNKRILKWILSTKQLIQILNVWMRLTSICWHSRMWICYNS